MHDLTLLYLGGILATAFCLAVVARQPEARHVVRRARPKAFGCALLLSLLWLPVLLLFIARPSTGKR